MMLIILMNFLNFSSSRDQIFSTQFLNLDTVIEISVVCNNQKTADDMFKMADTEIIKLDKIFNNHNKDSITSLINNNAGIKAIEVAPYYISVIKTAIKVSEETGGAFDITAGPLIAKWDVTSGPHQPPSQEEINKILPLINYKNIIITENPNTVFLKEKGMSIDLGGIAKRYIIDHLTAKIKEAGVRAALLNIGGDVKAYGKKPDGKLWKVGIENPRPEESEEQIIEVVELDNQNIATSGDYQRCFFWEGKRYHHIFDPKTGYPSSGLISVSIISDGEMLTSPNSTAVFVLGQEKGKDYINSKKDTKALLVVEDAKSKDGLNKIHINKKP